jgi:Ethanolamine utilization protein EutJ (predicted chaperonin)
VQEPFQASPKEILEAMKPKMEQMRDKVRAGIEKEVEKEKENLMGGQSYRRQYKSLGEQEKIPQYQA